MKEILDNGGKLKGDLRDGILWAHDDAFAQVMDKESSGRVRGVGFGPTPTGRSGSNLPCLPGPSSPETAQRMTALENSMRDQLAYAEQRHQDQMASLHAQHKEEIAEALAEAKRESDARHEQQLAEAMRESETRHQQQLAETKQEMAETKQEMAETKRKLDEVLAFLTKTPSSLGLSNLSGNTNFAFNLMKLACLLHCIIMCY